jgi:hypothetical protein
VARHSSIDKALEVEKTMATEVQVGAIYDPFPIEICTYAFKPLARAKAIRFSKNWKWRRDDSSEAKTHLRNSPKKRITQISPQIAGLLNGYKLF